METSNSPLRRCVSLEPGPRPSGHAVYWSGRLVHRVDDKEHQMITIDPSGDAPARQVPYSSLLNNNKPHNMLLTYVRLLCDFCIVSISKCLCGCCF